MTQRETNIGIIGDGQLALMLSEALMKRGISFLCLSHSSESPMHTFFPDRITGDKERFRAECDVFTLENEFHTISELKELLKDKASRLFPTLESYAFFADKISQRKFYEQAGIASPKWMPLINEHDLSIMRETFSFPFVLKTSKGGYDGKGVRVVRHEEDLSLALKEFKFSEGNHLLVEEKVQIVQEIAQGFLRDKDGNYSLLPLVDTIQEDGVCNLVHYPSSTAPEIHLQVENFLKMMMEKKLVGIFNFEFFVDKENRVLINEGAPRTHNSQHLTMQASTLSQFDLLAIYLSSPAEAPQKITTEHSIMVNILGKKSGNYGELKLPDLKSLEVAAKLYGKIKSSPGRKMGHVNVVDREGRADLLSVGRKILKEYDL